MMLPAPPLLVVTDRRQCSGPLEAAVEAALAAGCRWISLREKDLPGAEQATLARRLIALARPHGAVVTVHGPPDLAAVAGCSGVHLPAGGDPVAARRMLGPAALIGQSIHDRAEAEAAARAGVDYVVLGPIFPTASKPGYGPALEPAGLRRVAEGLGVPVIGIGGIEPDTVPLCLEAGAAGVAVMGSVMRSADPGGAVDALLATLGSGTSRPSPPFV